jgi:L-amino acid N-acyltransferase YncA
VNAKELTMFEQITKYRQLVTLPDGMRVLIRPLTPEDKNALVAFFGTISQDDANLMRGNVRDPQVVAGWAEHVDYTKVLPMVAVVNDRIVGDSTLHFRTGSGRHIADVRIFLAKDFRKCGLGTSMLRTMIEVAKKLGMQMVVAEVVSDQVSTIKAFQHLGFQSQIVLPDYHIMPDGETHDVNMLILHLVQKKEEF